MSLTDSKKREIDEMSLGEFRQYYLKLSESESSDVFAYLRGKRDAWVERVETYDRLRSLSSDEQNRLFDLCEKLLYTMKKTNRGPHSILLMMAHMLEERGWSTRERDTKQSLKVNRDRIMGSLKREIEEAEETVGCVTDTMKTRLVMAVLMRMSAEIGEYIAWQKAEIAAKGEQREDEKQDLEKIEQYMSLYYDVAYERLFQAFELNVEAKKILTDHGKPDAMKRRNIDYPMKLFGRLPNLSPKELDTLYDDARHNYDVAMMEIRMGKKEHLTSYLHMNDAESMCLLGAKGKKENIGLELMANVCKTGEKDKVYGELGSAIRDMKKELSDANTPVKDANVGASAFVALLGFALAALMIFVPSVHAFFEGPFFNEPSMVLLAIILIVIGVVALGVGGIPLCALAVVVYLGLTYFLFEVVGFGVILMGIITLAGLVFGVGGLVSMATDRKKLREHKHRGPAARAKVGIQAGECERYIDHLTDILKQYRAAAEKKPYGSQRKAALEDADLLLAYYDTARKQVREIGVEDDNDDLGF